MIRWARRRYNRDVFLVTKKVFDSSFIDQRTSLQMKAILLRFSGDKDAGKRSWMMSRDQDHLVMVETIQTGFSV